MCFISVVERGLKRLKIFTAKTCRTLSLPQARVGSVIGGHKNTSESAFGTSWNGLIVFSEGRQIWRILSLRQTFIEIDSDHENFQVTRFRRRFNVHKLLGAT